ncbi:MAG: MBOAT family protein [Chitinophagaceae bacterium]|nr:MBOAT family protein [Chitinophagaceae bacterium]
MLFNSLEFAFFLPVVFALYWLIARRGYALQNILLLAASYYFYGSWDVRFLALLAFSTGLDFFTGLQIHHASSAKKKKLWLTISVLINVGFLGFFKYYNFFIESFAQLLVSLGFQPSFTMLNIVLPVGISFYTFHGLSYVFDIYRGKITPTRKLIDYSLFVSFFPLLVAGPIERAMHLLPQVQAVRSFDAAKFADGLRQILWGLFKKVIIADNCAQYSSMVFNHQEQHSGGALLVGALFFMFEVYGDFSGYSDIALGTARLFGFELLQNFSYPYFSRNISEFWTRWHISLSSWFRDYVYIPLGGGRGAKWQKLRNVFIVFLLSGFWHGASFNRILWGGLHAVFMIPIVLMPGKQHRYTAIVAQGRLFPSGKELLQILSTFLLCTLALIVFRTTSIGASIAYLQQIFVSLFNGHIFSEIKVFWQQSVGITPTLLILMFIAFEWINRSKKYALENIASSSPIWLRWLLYFVLIAMLFLFANSSRQFIYFQF